MAAQVADPQVNAMSTEHPPIVLIRKTDRQQAVIRGTRMPVWIIAGYYKAGDTMDDILMSYPHLSPASVYDAISTITIIRQKLKQRLHRSELKTSSSRPAV